MRHLVSDIERLATRDCGEWILGVQAVLIRPEGVFQVEIGPRRRVFTGNQRAVWLPGAKGEAA